MYQEFKRNEYTPKDIVLLLDEKRRSEFFSTGLTLTFNHAGLKFTDASKLQDIQLLIKQFMRLINDDYFRWAKGRKKRLSKLKKDGISFSVVGIAEDMERDNFHVHLLLRVADGAVVNETLEKEWRNRWRGLTGSGTLKFCRYVSGFHHVPIERDSHEPHTFKGHLLR